MKFNKVYIEITNICGLTCAFCPTKSIKPNIMSLSLFENALIQIKNYTKVIALHIFGDPLTLSNLHDYFDLSQKYKLQIELTTTGFFLKEFDLNIFLHPAIRQINFSLNSYNKNNMKISIEEYMSNILKLCDLKLAKKNNNFINLRLWNLYEEKTKDTFNSKLIPIIENHFNISLKNKNNTNSKKQIRLENKILLSFDKYFIWPDINSTNNTNGYCHGLSSHFGILSDGTFVPCCLDGFGTINLGNINDSTINEILMSKRAIQIREKFKQNIAIEELCKKCLYKEKFTTS